MSRKATRSEEIIVEVEGVQYRLEWVIEGTHKLSQRIKFLDGVYKGQTKEEGFDYKPGDEGLMRATIPQLIHEVLRSPS